MLVECHAPGCARELVTVEVTVATTEVTSVPRQVGYGRYESPRSGMFLTVSTRTMGSEAPAPGT